MSVNAKSLACGSQRSSIREISAWAAIRREQVGANKVYDFSLGNPSVPAPDAVQEAIANALTLPSRELHGYTPAQGLPQVRAAVAASLCRRFGEHTATADDLYLTCGAAASLSITFHALLEPGDEVLIISPYFPEYRVWIEMAGAVCVEVPARADNFQIDVDAVARALTERTRAVVINSPNNPVGVVYPAEDLAELSRVLQAAEAKFGTAITLVSDEPYREIVYGQTEVPWVPALHPRTVVCYSYSKSLSLPGERIGWVLVPPTNPDHKELVFAVAGAGRRLGFVCAPSLFQHVLAACVDAPCNVEAYAENRRVLTEVLCKLGFSFVEPQGAFYLWLRSPDPDANAFFEQARELDLLPVPSDSFGCGGWLRIGYCVALQTIKDSMPVWAELARRYGVSAAHSTLDGTA